MLNLSSTYFKSPSIIKEPWGTRHEMKKVEQFHMINGEPTLAIPGEYSNVDHHLGNL